MINKQLPSSENNHFLFPPFSIPDVHNSIGRDADDDVLVEFTGNRELVLQANNPTALVKMIKWASTTASMVSAPSSKPVNVDDAPNVDGLAGSGDPFAPANNSAPLILDMSNIPNPDDFDEGAVK